MSLKETGALWGTTISCTHSAFVGACASSLCHESIVMSFGGTLRLWQGHTFRRLPFSILGLPPSRHLPCCGRCGLLGKGLSSWRPLVDCAWNGWDALVRILTRHSLAWSVLTCLAGGVGARRMRGGLDYVFCIAWEEHECIVGGLRLE